MSAPEQTMLSGLRVFATRTLPDARGAFAELFHAERYAAEGLDATFVQDNLSRSHRDVLRGLHFQHPRGQGKLVTVLSGAVFDVAVDVRRGSPTFGQWAAMTLSAENGLQLWIPEGFAHGFVVTSDSATVLYKCTDVYVPATERTIRWDDPALGIAWPLRAPILSEKDAAAPTLAALPDDALPRWNPPAAT